MKRALPILLVTFTILMTLVPGFMLNVHAVFGCSTPCSLEADTGVPTAEGTVRVSVTQNGGGAYNGICPASCFNLNHTWAFANNTSYVIQVLNPVIIGPDGYRYTFKEWDYHGQYFDGSASNPTLNTPPMYTNYTAAQCHLGTTGTWLNCPFTAVFTVTPPLGCRTNCYMDLFTNLPASEGTVKVQVDGGTTYSLTQLFPYLELSFGNGTGPHSVTVLNSSIAGGSGAKWIWKQWSCTCGITSTSSTTLTTPVMYENYTDPRSAPINPQGAVTALFDKEYPLTLQFVDNATNSLSPPASLQIVNGQTTLRLTSYSGIYVTAALWKVQNVTWQGISGIEFSGQTVDLTNGPATGTIKLQAYSATVKAVDAGNNPLSGVLVTVTLANQTSTTLTTNNQGLAQIGEIPMGTYTAQISYQGKSICNCVVSAVQTPIYTVNVQTGIAPGSQPVVSSIVLLAILGIAMFLIVLAVKVRKTPPPPSIQ